MQIRNLSMSIRNKSYRKVSFQFYFIFGKKSYITTLQSTKCSTIFLPTQRWRRRGHPEKPSRHDTMEGGGVVGVGVTIVADDEVVGGAANNGKLVLVVVANLGARRHSCWWHHQPQHGPPPRVRWHGGRQCGVNHLNNSKRVNAWRLICKISETEMVGRCVAMCGGCKFVGWVCSAERWEVRERVKWKEKEIKVSNKCVWVQGYFWEYSIATGTYLKTYGYICGLVRFGRFSISRVKKKKPRIIYNVTY